MSAEVLGVLREVRKLLADEWKWTKNSSAKNEEGCRVPALHKSASCWCLLGAIDKFAHVDTSGELHAACSESLRNLLPGSYSRTNSISIVLFNDSSTTTHKDVLRLLDEAIRTEEEKR